MCSPFDRLLNYTPPAVVIRLLTTNGLIAYITSWVLYLSGASSDPRLLLPAWISITTVFLPHPLPNIQATYQLIKSTSIPDPYVPLPRHAKPRHDQTRNGSRFTRRLGRQLRQHVFAPTAAPSDAGERARSPCFCHHQETMGLGRGDLLTYEGCGKCWGVVSSVSVVIIDGWCGGIVLRFR